MLHLDCGYFLFRLLWVLQEDGVEQKLPMASASRFPLWVIEDDAAGGKRVVQVPGEDGDAGWVNPRRYSECLVNRRGHDAVHVRFHGSCKRYRTIFQRWRFES